MAQHVFKLKPSVLDGTEKIFDHEKAMKAYKLPVSLDFRPQCPAVYDQGQEGSCTANAGCAARSMLAKAPGLYLSRAFQYYMERKLEGDTDQDAGASMKDIITAMQQYGVCLDSEMPYVPGEYRVAPTEQDMKDALAYQIGGGQMVKGVTGIQTALATQTEAVLTGMTVYASMESAAVAKSGVLPMPKSDEETLGGHAVDIVGYLPELPAETAAIIKENCIEELLDFLEGKHKPSGYFIARNSWGADWGEKGYFYIPYAYVTAGYANEFWIMDA